MASPIRHVNVNRVFELMETKWKFPQVEKEKLKEFIEEYKLGRITGRIGKNVEGNMASVLYSLKLPLEFFNTDISKLTEADIKDFFKALMEDKIKKHVRKRVNGKIRKVSTGTIGTVMI